jgi:hypothetical protein
MAKYPVFTFSHKLAILDKYLILTFINTPGNSSPTAINDYWEYQCTAKFTIIFIGQDNGNIIHTKPRGIFTKLSLDNLMVLYVSALIVLLDEMMGVILYCVEYEDRPTIAVARAGVD